MRTAFASILVLATSLASAQDTTFSIDGKTGVYAVANRTLGWRLTGTIEGPIQGLRSEKARDANGPYTDSRFTWIVSGTRVEGEVKCYEARHQVLFSLTYPDGSPRPVAFPVFTTLPANLKTFSYRDSTFAPASFSLNQTSTPWLLFNERAQAMIFSPASEFMIAKMVGDGKASIGASLNDRLRIVPKGFRQSSLLVFSQGIQRAWDLWGSSLRALYGRAVPAPDGSPILNLFGYWTDNGADYYYNYELDKGYAGTLKALVERYRAEGIPLGYLQLDSWWYQKSVDDPAGKPGGATKNPKLPAETWNRYGGTMVYRAHPALFPDGLPAFRREVGLPLVTHARWIDRKSPDREKYKFSGVGSIDPDWWAATADYLRSSGVFCYEQDWLDRIYDNSPEMSSVAGVADAFTDGMAQALMQRGMWMQYCMATPRFFLQGLKYTNLSTIRVSDDRFEPRKWAPFLYCSQLADAIGARPWCDVFKSGETGNMILAVLSAGPVGTGDAIGKEDKGNILKAARADGVIVRPDSPLVPCDQTYLKPDGPFLASTATDQHGYVTCYLFAFPRADGSRTLHFLPRDLGIDRPSYLYDFLSDKVEAIKPNRAIDVPVGAYGYWMAVPVSRCGIAILGDLGKFVPTGKQRVPWISESSDLIRVEMNAGPNEKRLTLEGLSPSEPTIKAIVGEARLVSFDQTTKRFMVSVTPAGGKAVFVAKP